jgi:hypothetical protein
VFSRLKEGGTKASLIGASSSVTDPAMITSSVQIVSAFHRLPELAHTN